MSYLKFWKAVICYGFSPLYGGGGGGSSSSDASTNTTTNTTNNTNYADKRNVASDGAVAVSGDGNVISSTTTDFGSVQAALTMAGNVAEKSVDLGTASLSDAFAAMKAAQDSNTKTFSDALALIGANADKTNDAFKTAQDEVNGNRVLVVVGMIVVGFVVAKKGFA